MQTDKINKSIIIIDGEKYIKLKNMLKIFKRMRKAEARAQELKTRLHKILTEEVRRSAYGTREEPHHFLNG